jgi:hypothetical protein
MLSASRKCITQPMVWGATAARRKKRQSVFRRAWNDLWRRDHRQARRPVLAAGRLHSVLARVPGLLNQRRVAGVERHTFDDCRASQNLQVLS